jgi:hypothetical protein
VPRSRCLITGVTAVLAMIMPLLASTAANGATTHSRPAPLARAIPLNAHGCNGQVRLTVTGSGLHVASVTINYTGSICINNNDYGTVKFSKPSAQYDSDTAFGNNQVFCNPDSDKISVNRNFANGSTACATIFGVSGKPCETIHS